MVASLEPVTRGEVEEFDPIRISPSRVNAYLQCGVAFRRKYIDGETPKVIGSAALFGNVMHDSAEKWALNRSHDYVRLTAQSWLDLTKGTSVAQFIEQYQNLSVEAMRVENAIRESWRKQGRVSKAPRMTAEWKKSEVAIKIEKLLLRWLPKLKTDSPWHFSERDPLPSLYDESLSLARKYSNKWNHLPAALETEFGFTVDWNGFVLRGFMDAIEPVLNNDKIVGYALVDYKTYRAEAPEAKDWRQGVIYDIAFEKLCETGALPYHADLDRWIVFDYMRLLKRTDMRVNSNDREQLHQELSMYHKAVTNDIFLPADKNMRVDFCDFPEDCCQRQRGAGTIVRGTLYPEADDEASDED